MVYAQIDLQRPNSPSDRKPGLFFDDNDTLDGSILGSSSLMSPASPDPRDAFSNGAGTMFSPESFFEDFSSTPFGQADRPTNSNNPFFEQNNNPFRLGVSQQVTYGQQPNPWPISDGIAETPTSAKSFEPFGQDFESGAPSTFMSVGPNSASTYGVPMHNVRPSSVFPPAQSATPRPISPHSNKDWMAMHAAQEAESRPLPKRMRPSSPPRTYSPFPRRDGGIRKKNARFDIPAERSLQNIDQLIASCNDEEQIKELKQQKRLLRNRQAALDSRQRKKRHTEDLENEKKAWEETQMQLTEELNRMRLQVDALLQEKEVWSRQQMEAQQVVETLQWEKEELVRTHTLETGELRKKVSFLTDKLENSPTSMSVSTSSTGYNDFTSDMDNLTMGGNDFDNDFGLFGDMISNEVFPSVQQQPPSETTLVVSHRKNQSNEISEDKAVPSGLLLMLLLCGAFVASKSSGTTAPPVPRMPDDVRAASATVLDSIFKDAGVDSSGTVSHTDLIANRIAELEPAPSGGNWAKSTLSGSEFASMSQGSTLDQLHNSLAAPSKAQEAEQLFSITPDQYNSYTSGDFNRRVYSISDDNSDALSPSSQPSHRRNLAETLAAMREDSKGDTAAEVYTRSLLWDRIPSEVVREFKRMVEQTGETRGGTPDTVVKAEG